jgi:type IV secretory pathway VirB9-like protein
LLSTADQYMNRVSFLYHDAPAVAPAGTPAKKTPAGVPGVKVAYEEAVPSPKRVLRHSEGKGGVDTQPAGDDGYCISGKAPWKPTRVYAEGGKTYIQMPRGMANTESPALFLLRKKGLFGNTKNLCNYRVHGRWYVVDSVLERAVLVAGTGSGKDQVTISRATK